MSPELLDDIGGGDQLAQEQFMVKDIYVSFVSVLGYVSNCLSIV